MILQIIVAVLAVWFFTYMVQNLAAPFNVFGIMRKKLRIREFDDGTVKPGSFRQLMGCFKCLSFWVSLPFAWHITNGFWQVLALTMAIAAAATFVQAEAEKRGM